MKYFSSLITAIVIGGILWVPSICAADFAQLSQDLPVLLRQVEQRPKREQAFKSFLRMYLWSKDNFEVMQWPEIWEQIQKWPQEWEALPTQEKRPLEAAYALLLHDYEQAQALQSDEMPHFVQLSLQALLGEPSPEQPGVWRIALSSARQLTARYPHDAMAQLILAEAYLERIYQPGTQLMLVAEAQRAVSRVLHLEPTHLYAHYQQGQIYYLQGHVEKANRYFQQQVVARSPAAAESIGNFYVWMQNPEMAWASLEQARQASPGRLRIYQKMEQLAALQGKPSEMMRLYLKGIIQASDATELYLRVVNLLPQFSATDMQTWMQEILPPRHYYTSLLEGDLAYRDKQFYQAQRWYEQALAMSPQHLEAYHNLLGMYWEAHQIDAMVALLNLAQKQNAQSHRLNYWRGVVALAQKRIGEAKRYLEPLQQQDERARYTLAMVYREEKNFVAARELLRQLVDQDPQNATLLLALGDTYFEAKQYPEAESTYLWAKRVAPYHADVMFSLGNLYTETARYPEAALTLERALLLSPDNLDIRNNLGNLYIRQQRLVEAIGIFEALIEQHPEYASAYYNLACAFALNQQVQSALKYLKKAFVLDPAFKYKASLDPDLTTLQTLPEFQDLLHD